MSHKVTKELFLADFPEFVFTPGAAREGVEARITGSVRLAQGRYRTEEEEFSRRERSLAAPLP